MGTLHYNQCLVAANLYNTTMSGQVYANSQCILLRSFTVDSPGKFSVVRRALVSIRLDALCFQHTPVFVAQE